MEYYLSNPVELISKDNKLVAVKNVCLHSLKVTWTALLSGSYIIMRGDLEKTVLVESLF